MTLAKCFTSAVFAVLVSANAQGALIFTLSDPEEEFANTNKPTVVETFESWQRGNFRGSYTNSFGTYTATKGKGKINKANRWGGSGGSGQYLFIPGGGNEMSLDFLQPVGYFGFWWSAGDARNRLSVTTRSQVVEFTTSDILNSPALTAAHYGNPSWGNPASPAQFDVKWEPFAFVNLFADSNLDEIISIKFYGSNFESDNHTIVRDIVKPSGTAFASFGTTAVPAPSGIALLAMALAVVSVCRRARS